MIEKNHYLAKKVCGGGGGEGAEARPPPGSAGPVCACIYKMKSR